MDVALIIISFFFCTPVIVLTIVYARSVERVIRLSKMDRVESLEEKQKPTSVQNPLKQAMVKAYTVED